MAAEQNQLSVLTKKLTVPGQKRGPKPYKATEKDRERVRTFARMGLSLEQCAARLCLSIQCFKKLYREEYIVAAEEANGTVVNKLYEAASLAVQEVPDRLADGTEVGTKRVVAQPGVTAAIYLTKARLGWSERNQLDVNHTFARRLDPDDEDL